MDAKTLLIEAVSGKHSKLANQLTDQLCRLRKLSKDFSAITDNARVEMETSMIELDKKPNTEDIDKVLFFQTVDKAIGTAQEGITLSIEGVNEMLIYIVSSHISQEFDCF